MSAAWQPESQRLVVKHTFLEFVDKEQGTGRAGRLRAFTDSALEPQFAPSPNGDRFLDRTGEESPTVAAHEDDWDPPADDEGFLGNDPLSATPAQVRDIASPQRGRSRCGSEADSAQPPFTNSLSEPSSRMNTTLDLDSAVTTTGYVHSDAQQAMRGGGPPGNMSSAAGASAAPAMMNARPQDFGPLMQFWMAMQASAASSAAMGANSATASDARSSGNNGPDTDAASKPRSRSSKDGVASQASGAGQARRRTAMNDSAPVSPQLLPGKQQPTPGAPSYDTMLQASALLMQREMQVQQGKAAPASRTPASGLETAHRKNRQIKNKAHTQTTDTRPRRQASDASDGTLAPVDYDSAAAEAAYAQDSSRLTTVMLRNLPNRYTRDMLLQMLDSEGFIGRYTFVYLPIDFKTHSGLGYAFVDLVLPEDAVRLRERFEGFSRWAIQSEKVCSVGWSAPAQQGLHAHVDRYRNSPVMHFSVSDEWKPAVFANGQRVPFPPPTRRLRAPNLRMLPQSKGAGDVA